MVAWIVLPAVVDKSLAFMLATEMAATVVLNRAICVTLGAICKVANKIAVEKFDHTRLPAKY